MKTLYTLIALIAFSMALHQAYRAAAYQQSYEAAMNHIEALNRTHGVVDVAYACKKH
jgi:hypothetical protein